MMRTLAHVVSCFTDAFGYDALGQVVSARFGEGSDPDLYDYDLIGNFVSNRLRGAWTQFDANALNEYESITTPSTPSTSSTVSTLAETAAAVSADPSASLSLRQTAEAALPEPLQPSIFTKRGRK